jgi:hypothetical protein
LEEHIASIVGDEESTEQEISVKQSAATTCFRAGFFFDLFFNPENEDDMFHRNVG